MEHHTQRSSETEFVHIDVRVQYQVEFAPSMNVCTYWDTYISAGHNIFCYLKYRESTIDIITILVQKRILQKFMVYTNHQAKHIMLRRHLVVISIGKNQNTYRDILSDFRVRNYGCRYALCWLNRVFGSSISNRSCLWHI